MGQPAFRFWVLLGTLLFAAQASATEYVITATNDADNPGDGVCTLREAMQAIDTQAVYNECEAGTTSNSFVLTEAETYVMTGGQLEVGATNPVNLVVTVERDGPFDESERDNPVIDQQNTADRIFYIHDGSSLTISNVTLQGGQLSGSDGIDADDFGRGGQIFIEGTLRLLEGAVLDGGSAVEGGALYLLDGELRITDSLITNHSATGLGGALAVDPAYQGILSIQGSYFGGNTSGANGGAMLIAGTNTILQLTNTTFYGNQAVNGGAFRIDTPDRTLLVNNITVAGNTSSGDAAVSLDGLAAAPTNPTDVIYNSAVVGNLGGDCASDDAGTTLDYAALEYVVSDGSCAPLDLPTVNLAQYTTATFEVLEGLTVCDGGAGPTCDPIEFENGQLGFLPNPDALADIGAAVLDSGSPVDAVQGSCETQDQRTVTREDTCDAGAIELRIARGVTDEIEIVTGVTTTLDVLENDLGEVGIDCTPLVPAVPVTAAPGDPAVEPCMAIVVEPERGTLLVDIDANGYPTLVYTPRSGFHGIDDLRYEVPDAAFDGKTLGDRGAAAAAFLVVEPASGLTEKSDITDETGSLPVLALLFSLPLLVLRRRRTAAMVALALVSAPALAADIEVDILDDTNTVRGDGVCTLREALGNAIDNNPLFSRDCEAGATGRDRILLPAGVLTLTRQLDVDGSAVEVIGQQPGTGPEATIIEGSGTSRIFQASSDLVLRNLTLRNGNVSGDGGAVFTSAGIGMVQVELLNNTASGDGGAIFLNANPFESRDVEFESVYASGNTAGADGGVMATFGQNQQHRIFIKDSAFIGNIGSNGAGAMDLNLVGGIINILNTTFSNNQGAAGFASALDLQDSEAAINIMNSTFLNFDGSNGASGAINSGSNTTVRMYNTIYSSAGTCSSDPASRLAASLSNLFDVGRSDTCWVETATDEASDGNNTADSGDISTVLSGGVLTIPNPAWDVDEETYTVPFFPIDRTQEPAQLNNPAYPLIVNAGDPGSQFADANAPSRCRTTDVRGESRLAGADRSVPEGCDLGAYELQVPTAIEDSGSNRGGDSREVIIDVLANDLTGDTGTILTDSIAFPVPSAQWQAVLRDDTDVACTPASGDDCVVKFVPPPLACPGDFETDDPEFTINYTFDVDLDPGTETSTEGLITATVLNVPPFFDNQVAVINRGEDAVFPLSVEDVDGNLDWGSLELSDDPLFAIRDDNGTPEVLDDDTFLGSGIIVNTTNNTVTYKPRDVSKAFNDSFTLTLKDDCGDEGSGRFQVIYRDDSAAGGDLVGGGSLGYWVGLLMLLVPLRRRV